MTENNECENCKTNQTNDRDMYGRKLPGGNPPKRDIYGRVIPDKKKDSRTLIRVIREKNKPEGD